MTGLVWGEENTDAFLDRELVYDQSFQGPFPLPDAGKGIREAGSAPAP